MTRWITLRRALAAVALLTAAGAVVGAILETSGPSGTGRADAATTASGATTVQRRDLVETDTESGTLSYANPQTVYNRLTGTITWLPAVGQVIKPGGTLFKIDGQPVLLMSGSTPAFRDLGPSDTAGQDILELNRNLVRLGYNPDGIVVDDEWQAATTDGVDVLQAALGETETGILKLGRIVFLPGDQLVSTLDATVGSDGGSGGSSPGSSNAADVSPSAGPEFVSLEKPVTGTTPPRGAKGKKGSKNHGRHGSRHHPSTSQQELQALEQLLRAEEAQLRAAQHNNSPSSPSHHNSSNNSSNSTNNNNPSSNSANPSSGGATPTAILQTTSTRLVATVDLDPSKQSEAKVGEKVTVEMPAGNTVQGRISSVSPVAESSSSSNNNNGNGNGNGNGNSGSTSAIPITITLKGRHLGAGLDQAAVSVNFVQAVADNVLSVPVTALLATSGGNYAVQEAAAPHKLIPVTTGLFAAGDVQISGPGIYDGLQVTDSQG